jgi:hypothetical protein
VAKGDVLRLVLSEEKLNAHKDKSVEIGRTVQRLRYRSRRSAIDVDQPVRRRLLRGARQQTLERLYRRRESLTRLDDNRNDAPHFGGMFPGLSALTTACPGRESPRCV